MDAYETMVSHKLFSKLFASLEDFSFYHMHHVCVPAFLSIPYSLLNDCH